MVDLQLFAEEGGAAPPPVPLPALSRCPVAAQAIASGTMKQRAEAPARPLRNGGRKPGNRAAGTSGRAHSTGSARLPPRLPAPGRGFCGFSCKQWAAEEALLRRDVPGFSLKAELRDPEMRRLMQLPGMRLGCLPSCITAMPCRAARTVGRGGVERIRQRASRPAENGTPPAARQ